MKTFLIFFVIVAFVQSAKVESPKSLLERGKDQFSKLSMPDFKLPEMPSISKKMVGVNNYKEGLKKKLVEFSKDSKSKMSDFQVKTSEKFEKMKSVGVECSEKFRVCSARVLNEIVGKFQEIGSKVKAGFGGE